MLKISAVLGATPIITPSFSKSSTGQRDPEMH